jgi:hypothetical protein
MSHVKRGGRTRTNFPVIIISRTESKAKVHVSAHGRRAHLNLESMLGQEIKAESFGSRRKCAAVAAE